MPLLKNPENCVTVGQLKLRVKGHLLKEIICKFKGKHVKFIALIDSGAMGFGCMDFDAAVNSGCKLEPLDQAIEVRVVDGEPCGAGIITNNVVLEIAFVIHR